MVFSHKSVLLQECLEGLRIQSDGLYVDCTLGGAGHSQAICEQLGTSGRLIGIDRDANAIQKAKEVLLPFEKQTTLVHENFFHVKQIAEMLDLDAVDGFLVDLGVSSHQLDEPMRGFSYMADAPLDMRMDVRERLSAYDVVNEYSEKKLMQIMYDYGEERWAKRIAEFIVQERKNKPIETTFELVSVIKKAVPKGARSGEIHPARRTFQAIRIEVNAELMPLRNAVRDMVSLLNKGGRICIITFHSLEDRIIKNAFRELVNPCTCPVDFPICVCNLKPSLRIITTKPILPSGEEIANNSRARSAKLRIAEKI